ncbi:MAG: hypothetical protein HYY35_09535 [Deltaproteobacteria bacterium]|nr:hypothetical protein [Deltaproteobacteria bacterium]
MLGLVLGAGSARALELRAWPLLEIETRHGATHGRLLGPLIEWQRDAEGSALALRPLFYSSRSAGDGSSRGFLLYPLASWTRSREELSFRFLGLGSYVRRRTPPPERPYRSELTIYPFVFYRDAPDSGRSLSVLPFYADVEGLLGYQRIRMLLFPLYLRLEEPLWRRTWLPFPFFSRVGGTAGEGVRLWPIWGHTVLGAEYESSYVAWPLYVRAVAHPGRAGAVATRISWPLFSALDGPRIESRSYAFLLVLPLYTHTIDRASDTEIEGFPWPFWTIERELSSGRRRSLRLTPLYQDRRTATMHSVFYFWPFYRRHEGLGDDAAYRRADVLFLFYRDQHEGEGDMRLHTRALVPLWIDRDSPRAGDAQAPTLLDGLFPKNPGLRLTWAPLYRLYGAEHHGAATHRDVLWRMWSWGDGKLVPPWYLSFD